MSTTSNAADPVPPLLRRVLETPTAPAREHDMVAVVRDVCRRGGLDCSADADDNLLIRQEREVADDLPPLVFVAHMDHPAFEFLGGDQAEFLGGVRDEYFASGAWLRFVDGRRARCLGRLDEQPGRRVLRLDRSLPHTPVGTIGRWQVPLCRAMGRRLHAWGIDDLAGVAALLLMLRQLRRRPWPCRTWVLLTRAEEIGFLGSLAAVQSGLIPDDALVVSIEASNARGRVRLGGGPVIRVGDRSSLFDSIGLRFVEGVAATQRRSLWQKALMDGGTCEATVWSVYGYRCAGLCLPLQHYHNMGPNGRPRAEVIDLDDFDALVGLCLALSRAWPTADLDQERLLMRERLEAIPANAPRRLRPLG